jgi:hypothetical protein
VSENFVIDRKRWENLSIFDQMGNIYSEVGRSFNARKLGSLTDQQAATYRALDLFDATIAALLARKSPQLKEVLRAKEQFLTILHDSHSSQESIQSLDRYFLQFALAARLKR